MPYTRFNNATFPAQDNALLATAPAPGSANYGQAILDYVKHHNQRNKPFHWTKTADEILDKMRRFGLRVQQVYGQ